MKLFSRSSSSSSSSQFSKFIETTSSIEDTSTDGINTSDKSLYENKMDYIEACKENMEILLLCFKNIDMYCYKYAFDLNSLYETIL